MQQGMMIPPTPPRMGPAVWRYGLIFGGILAAIGAGNAFLQLAVGGFQLTEQVDSAGTTTAAVASDGPSLLLAIGGLLIVWGLTFTGGILAARAVGKVGAGSLAGLIVGALGGLVSSLTSLLIVIFIVAPMVYTPDGSSLDTSTIQSLLIGVNVAGAAFQTLCDAGLGAGLGALGGLWGRSMFRSAHPEFVAQPYPYGYPSPYSQPLYPGQPVPPGAYPPAQPAQTDLFGQPAPYSRPYQPYPYGYPPVPPTQPIQPIQPGQPGDYPPPAYPGTQYPGTQYPGTQYPGYPPTYPGAMPAQPQQPPSPPAGPTTPGERQ